MTAAAPDPAGAVEPPAVPQLRLDLDRRSRIGLVEAIWGQDKTVEQLASALRQLLRAGEVCLVTRLSPAKAESVLALLRRQGGQQALLRYHPEAELLCDARLPDPEAAVAPVAIVAGGSSDLRVAREAHLALACHGVASELVLDVGVAGLHRLLARLEQLRAAPVLIACAGMEGALPTVLAGLLPQPVIAVPVSVGYGVSAGGEAALRSMLASCAPGLVVVNIDNGYGAAMAALRILGPGGWRAGGWGQQVGPLPLDR